MLNWRISSVAELENKLIKLAMVAVFHFFPTHVPTMLITPSMLVVLTMIHMLIELIIPLAPYSPS